MSKLHNVQHLDSVRIEVLGETRALQMPCSLIVDLDDALKKVREDQHALVVYMLESHTGGDRWFAECGGKLNGIGATPWQAIANIANKGLSSNEAELQAGIRSRKDGWG